MNHDATARLLRISRRVDYGKNWYDGRVFFPDRASHPNGSLSIAWVGRFEGQKDPLLAIAVFRELKRLDRPFHAWMAGTGALLDDARRQIAHDGLGSEVELAGELNPSELAARLRHSSVFLMTSKWEGLPRAALEALACGTPVVAPPCGDLEHVISDLNGRVVRSRDPRDLAGATVEAAQSVSRAAAAASARDYEMRRVLDRLFRNLALRPA